MAEISQNVNIEMLEKLPDGTYKRKYPKTRADDGTTFDEHLAGYVLFVEQVEKELDNYNSYASNKDDNGTFTMVEYKDSSSKLYMTSTLSNPDDGGNYQTMTWVFVSGDTVVWNITYDEDGDIVSKVVSL